MFKNAYEVSKKFTLPMIVSVRYYDKTVEGGLGAFVIINDDGWLMTAAHNLFPFFAFDQSQKEIKEFDEKVERINSNKKIKESQRKALARKIKPNLKWITAFSVDFGLGQVSVLEDYIYPEHDIAFLRVDSDLFKRFTVYPKIIDPNSIINGTSLLKMGFPFTEINPVFDEEKNIFDITHVESVPFFPIDGIYTRNINNGMAQDESMEILFLETSSPGLRGQSGGPICDTEGNIYAIQSQNITMPMGFKGTVNEGKKTTESDQFLNLGIGVHPRTIVTLLNKHNIKFDKA